MDRLDEESALRALIDGAGDERAATVVVERVVPRLTSFLRARYPVLSPDDAHDVARSRPTAPRSGSARVDVLRTTIYRRA